MENKLEIRDAISDLVCLIDVAEMTDMEKLEAINYAIQQLIDLKNEL